MNINYLEIVTNDVDSLCAAYERVHALSFGPEDPDLGQARVAVRPDGSLVGIRKPLAEHEQPTTRTYLAVADIQKAVKKSRKPVRSSPILRHGRESGERSPSSSTVASNTASGSDEVHGNAKGRPFRTGSPRLIRNDLFHADSQVTYGLSLDGDAILIQVQDWITSAEIRVVVNWFDELVRTLPH